MFSLVSKKKSISRLNRLNFKVKTNMDSFISLTIFITKIKSYLGKIDKQKMLTLFSTGNFTKILKFKVVDFY